VLDAASGVHTLPGMQTSANTRFDRDGGSSSIELQRQPRRSVDLDIAGGDFMLQGHFSDWESALAVGPDLRARRWSRAQPVFVPQP
jgi:hypothetical protein